MLDYDLALVLETAIKRVEIANKEGDPILSAWLPDAKAAAEKIKQAKKPRVLITVDGGIADYIADPVDTVDVEIFDHDNAESGEKQIIDERFRDMVEGLCDYDEENVKFVRQGHA